jgi:Tfp pilus assembly protein PilV
MHLNLSLQTLQKLKRDPIGDASDERRGMAVSISPRRAHSKGVQAMTLVELMVAVVIASLVIGLIAVASMTSAHWFAALANYVDMDVQSRNALDQMTLKIRQAGALTEFSTNHLKFAIPGQTNSFLIYDWDSTTGSLIQWTSGDSITNTLLLGCNQLAFSMYDASFAATTNLAKSKGLGVNWNCSRTILGRKTTEEMQQAVIAIRNNSI